jgi:hypothetical protein
MKQIFLFALIVALLPLVSCTSSIRADGARGALSRYSTAVIVVDPDDSGDAVCKKWIERELQTRGIQTTKSPEKADLKVEMSDTWYWDIVMYLLELDVAFLDARTGEIRARAHYRNSPAHGYPSRSAVVERLFQKLDAEGVFEKR